MDENKESSAKGYFCKGPYAFMHQTTPIIYKKDASVMSEADKLDKVLSLLENRFKMRKKPHSLQRLDNILSGNDFVEYTIPEMLDKVVAALEKKQRTFEKIKRSKGKKRQSRKRGR